MKDGKPKIEFKTEVISRQFEAGIMLTQEVKRLEGELAGAKEAIGHINEICDELRIEKSDNPVWRVRALVKEIFHDRTAETRGKNK